MSTANTLLQRANVVVRKGRPHRDASWRYDVRHQPTRLYPEPFRQATMTFVHLRSYGCRFDRTGECTMCNYGIGERLGTEAIVNAAGEALAKTPHYEALYMSPAGSMFDPLEVPNNARRTIFEMIAATDCSSFSCESRPEFLSDEALAEFAKILSTKRRFINIGLESAHPWILRNCVGKFMDIASFKDACQRMLKTGTLPVANVLLGAPFLTEGEALQEAVNSVNWALSNGAYMCVLFPSNVKDWTLQYWLWERGLYSPPSLWSYIEALYLLGEKTLERVGLSKYAVPVSGHYPVVPHTCPECYGIVVKKLNGFVTTGDFQLLEEARRETPCGCHSAWLKSLGQVAPNSLRERVAGAYDRIGSELIAGAWWPRNRDEVLASLAHEPTFEIVQPVMSI